MIDNKNDYYNEDRDKIEKFNKIEESNKIEELKSIEKSILDESDELTSTIIIRHQLKQ